MCAANTHSSTSFQEIDALVGFHGSKATSWCVKVSQELRKTLRFPLSPLHVYLVGVLPWIFPYISEVQTGPTGEIMWTINNHQLEVGELMIYNENPCNIMTDILKQWEAYFCIITMINHARITQPIKMWAHNIQKHIIDLSCIASQRDLYRNKWLLHVEEQCITYFLTKAHAYLDNFNFACVNVLLH